MKTIFLALLLYLCGTPALYAQLKLKPEAETKSAVMNIGITALIESNELWVYVHEEPEDPFTVVDTFSAAAGLGKLLEQRLPKKQIDLLTQQVKTKYPKADGLIVRSRKLEGKEEQIVVFKFK